MDRSTRFQAAAIVLVVIAVLFAIVGIIYLTQTANHLPGFIPGKPSAAVLKKPLCTAQATVKHCYTPRKYTKRGIAALAVAGGSLVGAWYVYGMRKSRRHAHSTAA